MRTYFVWNFENWYNFVGGEGCDSYNGKQTSSVYYQTHDDEETIAWKTWITGWKLGQVIKFYIH